ncbi:MAG: RNA-directed DNA polymerase [Acidimicrobiaceae bacterium]|nr:RNA-directed DNA polymerase [Acidimicrobiaceae bacterium]
MKQLPVLHLSDEDVEASLKSAKPWYRDMDLPDPLGREDCFYRPDLLAEAARQRVKEGRIWGCPSTIDYPKINGGSRRIVAFDPPTEAIYRSQAGGVRSADRSLSRNVLHARVHEIDSRHWQVKSWRQEQERLRIMQSEWRRHRMTVGLLDIKDHYGSIRLDALENVLHSCGLPHLPVERLIASLRSLCDFPGIPKGLPVGCEPSAILGTVALLPLDRVITRESGIFVRWMDDVRLPGISRLRYDHLIGAVTESLSRVGQSLNLEKSIWPEEGMEDQVPSLLVARGVMFCDEAVDILEMASASGEYARVNQALGVLGNRGDIRGLEIIGQHLELFYRSPAPVGRYLKQVQSCLDAWEPLLDLMHLADRVHHPIVLVHLAQSLPHALLSAAERQQIFDLAVSALEEGEVVLSPFLFTLCTRGARNQVAIQLRKRAFDLVHEVDDFNIGRSLLMGLRSGGSLPKTIRKQLAELGQSRPDLECTTEWVLAA